MEIIFNTGKMSPNQQEKLKQWLEVNILKLSENLELSTLDRIIISSDMKKDVTNTQIQYNLKEMKSISGNNELIRVFHTEIRNELRQSIIINDSLIMGLFSTERVQKSFHSLHRELCRVHNNYIMHHMPIIREIQRKKNNEFWYMLNCNAKEIWSEYISVRLSSMSVELKKESLLDNLYLSQFSEVLSLYKSKIEEYKVIYRAENKVEQFLSLLQEETLLLFKSSATVQAYMDGLKISREKKIITDINMMVSDTYFCNSWLSQWKILNYLYDTYPNWNNKYQVLELGKCVNSFWISLGIHVSYNQEIEHISIKLKNK